MSKWNLRWANDLQIVSHIFRIHMYIYCLKPWLKWTNTKCFIQHVLKLWIAWRSIRIIKTLMLLIISSFLLLFFFRTNTERPSSIFNTNICYTFSAHELVYQDISCIPVWCHAKCFFHKFYIILINDWQHRVNFITIKTHCLNIVSQLMMI